MKQMICFWQTTILCILTIFYNQPVFPDSSAQDGTLIVYNAKITTLHKDDDVTAVAVKNGKIIRVGNDEDILKLKDEHTKVIDANGRRLVPGLNDSHSHFIRGGLDFTQELRWDGVPTLKDALELIRKQARHTPQGKFVRVVGGWTPYQFKEKRMPTLRELDEASPDRPVYIQNFYNRAMLNSLGLKVMGFNKDTITPDGAKLGKDENGDLNGLLIAEPHPALLYQCLAKLPKLSAKERKNSSLHLYYHLARFGLTSIIDAGGGGHLYPGDYKHTLELAEEGKIPLRVSCMLFTKTAGKELSGYKEWLKVVKPGENLDKTKENGFTISSAGEMIHWDAADFENFNAPRPELPKDMEKKLKEVLLLLVENRWPFRLHATYNESITRIVNVIAEVDREVPLKGLRWSIEHAETVDEYNINRIKALGGGIAIQNRMAFLGEEFIDRYGADIAKNTPPIRLMLKKGVPVGLGTDATRGPSCNPWGVLYWLVSGKTVGGTLLYEKQNRLTRREAIALYTTGSAWFSGEEKVKGRIAPGQYADFTLLSKDYFTIAEEQIPDIESVLTVIAGKVVYGAEEFTALMPKLPPILPQWSPVARFGVCWNDSKKHR